MSRTGNKEITFIPLFQILVPAICLLLLISCSMGKDRIFRKSRFLMDTIVTITVVSDDKRMAEDSIDTAFREIELLGKLLNYFSEHSEVSAVNRNAGIRPASVSPETMELLERAATISEATGGAFDISIGPLISLYDFTRQVRPPESLIRERLPLVNYADIILDTRDNTAFLKRKGMFIDTGGITKGYAADRAAALLQSRGIRAALIAVAGDIRGYGLKPDGKAWRVGIRDPRGKAADDIIASIEVRDSAISTSGDYERFFIDKGIRYHHLINPKTGHPARDAISVTVTGPLAVYTDSLSTAFFVTGKESGFRTAGSLGYDILFFDNNGTPHMTDGIRNKVEFIKRSN